MRGPSPSDRADLGSVLGPPNDLILRVWCADPAVAFDVKYDITEAIKKRFDAEGIEIPFAYQNVIVKSWPESAAAGKPDKKDENRE